MGATYIKLIPIAHQCVMQQMPIHLMVSSHQPSSSRSPDAQQQATHLRLDQDQIDKQDNIVMLNIFVAKAAAVLADREPDVVAARLVTTGVGVFCP